MTEKTKKAIKRSASTPPLYTKSDVYALQALAEGIANADQQKRALKWIIESAAATYDLPYWADNDSDTAFSCGRMFVGQQTVKLIKLNPEIIKE